MKKIFNLENAIYITIVSMPFYLVRVVILGVPTNVFELAVIFLIVGFVISRWGSKIELGDYKKYYLPIIMIVGGSMLSAVHGGSYQVGAGIIKSWFVLPIIFAFMASNTLSSKKILSAIYVSAFGVSCLAALYLITGDLTFDGRLEALYNSPNYLAMFLAPAVVIGSGLFSERKKYYAPSLLLIVGILYATFSYSAWIAVLVAVGFLFFKQAEKKIYWKKTSFLVLICIVLLFSQFGTHKLESIIQLEERSSLFSRLMIWSAAEKIISDNPFLGIGPGNFQVKYLEYQKYFPPYLEWAVPEPHNIFLAFWLQAGLVGMLGFLILLFRWLKDGLFDEDKKIHPKAFIPVAIIIYILVHGITDTTYFKNDLAVIFWLAIFMQIKSPKHSLG